MKPEEIKAELTRKNITMTAIANEANCKLPQVSMCIHGNGVYTKIRQIIANALDKPVTKIFNKHHPKPKRNLAV